MASCFENFQMPSCVWFEGDDKRNPVVSIIAGIMFFAGWWFIIDVHSNPDTKYFNPAFHVCGVFGTLSLIMINSVSNSMVRGDAYSGGCFGPQGARAWLFVGFVIGFGAVIASCGILIANYMSYEPAKNEPQRGTYPGVGLFLQNALIFIGSLVFKFGRVEDHWN